MFFAQINIPKQIFFYKFLGLKTNSFLVFNPNEGHDKIRKRHLLLRCPWNI